MIQLNELTKRYRSKKAVDKLSVAVRSGVVTGFLGPNGAGKSTTLHMLLGLSRPTSGSAFIDGVPYNKIRFAAKTVGALLSVDVFNVNLTAEQHLRLICAASGLADNRVQKCLEVTGIASYAKQAISTFSLGMKQRLGIAAALLGEPKILIMDEPFNGLDAEGIRWLRQFVVDYAKRGNIVLISSHLMGEIEAIADDVIILSEGKLIANGSVHSLCSSSADSGVRVRAENIQALSELLAQAGAVVELSGEQLHAKGIEAMKIGRIANEHHIALHELTEYKPSLENVFFKLISKKNVEAS